MSALERSDFLKKVSVQFKLSIVEIGSRTPPGIWGFADSEFATCSTVEFSARKDLDV